MTNRIDRIASALIVPTGALTALLLVTWLYRVAGAPIDGAQGIIQKILYLHPPQAFAAYLGFFSTAFFSALYLWRRDIAWDRAARSAAEVGVLFCTLMIITGPIWAKGTWGKWWTFDLRLTLTLLLWFIYLAYLLLRAFAEGSERGARFAAVYGIVGLCIIPLNYYAIELAGGRSMHPENLEGGSLGEGMGWPFALGVATHVMAFVFLWAARTRIEGLRETFEELQMRARAASEELR